MNKSMKQSKPAAGNAPALTPEQKEEMIKRQFMQKRASLAEGILYNLCQGFASSGCFDRDEVVDASIAMADRMMAKLYGQEIVVKEAEA